jgi:hypothetical protein
MVAAAPYPRVGLASLGRQDETLAVDIGRESLDPDQLATEFFQTVIVETKAELKAVGCCPR